MKTILVPTDFSDTSRNAAIYAFDLAKQVKATKIILYNTYNVPLNIAPDPLLPSISTMDIDEIKEGSISGLQYFKNQLINECPLGVEIELLSNYGIITSDINEVCNNTNTELIVIGITGGGILTETLLGSNATVLAKSSPVPVIIVPQKTHYKHITRLLLVSDFDEVETSTPIMPIKKILDETQAEFVILHIAENSHHSLYEGSYECQAFKDLFESYNPEFHFIVNQHFSEAINEFVEKNLIDITVIVPKKNNFLESMFTKSHTKELAFHSHIPLLAVHI